MIKQNRQALRRRRLSSWAQGTVRPRRTTGPRVGSSSVAWKTPGGGIVSITLGTVVGSTEQMGLIRPEAHTPKLKA